MSSLATLASRWVGMRTAKPGEARVVTNCHAAFGFHGRGITHGCVVSAETRKVSPRSYTRHPAAPAGAEPVAEGNEIAVGVSGINQHIGIDYEHYRPSMAWYRASRWEYRPGRRRWERGQGDDLLPLALRGSSRRSAVSTSSDMVRPWRTASRLVPAMTRSSIIGGLVSYGNMYHYDMEIWRNLRPSQRPLI